MKPLFFLFSFFFFLILHACSLNRMAVRQMTPILQNSAEAVYEETDLQIAEQALASNLKLLEGLMKSDPGNQQLILLTVQGFAGYALGFAEDEDTPRARALYLRARTYGFDLLEQNKSFRENRKGDMDSFIAALKTFEEDDVPALFWTGFSWAGYLNLSLSDPMALIELPRVEALMNRVMELDSTFFYGGAQLFFGSMYGMKPRMMGGDPDKAKAYFERSLRISGNKFLLAYVYMAEYYAAKVLDEEAFDHYLEIVQQTPSAKLEGMPLLNEIAKKKAGLLAKRKEELF